MTSTLLIGTLAAFVATTLAAALRRAPTHTRCPACGEATVAVQPEAWLLNRMPDVLLRWCQACSWEGWGRNGAEWIPGHPAAHDSGFYWGEERFPEDFGFRFAGRRPNATPSAPPRHPSGFRFSAPPPARQTAHPSGFTFGTGENGGSTGAGEPAGFRWAPLPSPSGKRSGRRQARPPAAFAWKQPREGEASPGDPR